MISCPKTSAVATTRFHALSIHSNLQWENIWITSWAANVGQPSSYLGKSHLDHMHPCRSTDIQSSSVLYRPIDVYHIHTVIEGIEGYTRFQGFKIQSFRTIRKVPNIKRPRMKSSKFQKLICLGSPTSSLEVTKLSWRFQFFGCLRV